MGVAAQTILLLARDEEVDFANALRSVIAKEVAGPVGNPAGACPRCGCGGLAANKRGNGDNQRQSDRDFVAENDGKPPNGKAGGPAAAKLCSVIPGRHACLILVAWRAKDGGMAFRHFLPRTPAQRAGPCSAD